MEKEKKEKIYLKCGNFIAKNKWLYYLLSYTWGLLGTIAGWCTLAFLKIFKKLDDEKFSSRDYCDRKVYFLKNNTDYCFSIGTTVVLSKSEQIIKTDADHFIYKHEIGHTFQNALFGPLVIFLVYIPSAIRYHSRAKKIANGEELKTGYYDIWFESSANEFGETYVKSLKF